MKKLVLYIIVGMFLVTCLGCGHDSGRGRPKFFPGAFSDQPYRDTDLFRYPDPKFSRYPDLWNPRSSNNVE